MESHEPLGFISLNTRGLGDIRKRLKLINWLNNFHNAKSKIIFLQETHSTERSEQLWKDNWEGYEMFFSHGDSNSRGVAVAVSKQLDYTVNDVIRSQNGRYIALNITIDKSTFCIINCYCYNCDKLKDQLKWLNEIQNILLKNNNTNIVIGGDLNDVFIPMLDRYRCKPKAVETDYVKAWKTVCEEFDIVDIWRLLNPNKQSYTWRQGSSATRLKQSRLDYWLISIHMTYDLNMVDIKPSTGSDHSLINLDFYKSDTQERGPSFWRFNASLLKEQTYVDQINTCYRNAIEKYDDLEDKGLKWDLVKMEMRTSTISYSKFKAKEKRDHIKESVTQLNNLEKQINQDPTDDILEQYNRHKKYIENYNDEKTNGAMLRSKVDWTEHGEKNTKFFLNLEKRNYNLKCITKLIDNEQKEITEAPEILKYEEEFYKTLYSSNKTAKEIRKTAKDNFMDKDMPKLKKDDKQSCETPITIEELGVALRELKNGKSPGSDGLTTDFYKFFWVTIKTTVKDSINYAYETGKLSIDQRRGIINLIPKKDKDPRSLKNWRPISLLNTDYKILTKLLANRLKKVLPSVIHPDQVAYLKKRFIGQNIRTIIDIMGYTKLMDKNGIIVFLDFEKAFDTINWDVIYDSLTLFNIGPVFINWVKTIYNESEACVTNNGFSSPFFKLERGVRQGCPLSAYLFIMVVEILANKIRKSNNIKGIKIGTTEIKTVQMADDTTAFMEDTKSLEHLLEILNKFEQYAGLKLNKTKTEAMWIGKQINNVNTPLEIKWVKHIRSLGIFFSYDNDYVVQKNFMDRAKEFKRILDMWQQRNLSLIGKITILKSLAFSKIIYQCGILDSPPKFIEHINDLAYKFLWSNKKDKIKRKTIIAEYEDGGLKMLDITSFIKAQKAMWVKRLVSEEQGSWKALPMLYLSELLGKDTFKCNMSCNTKPPDIPIFYWNIIESWFELKTLTTETKSTFEIRRETLWLNKHIILNKEELNWKTWSQNGINQIHDIVDSQGKFLSPEVLEEKYNIKVNMLQYISLKDTIPANWRKTLKQIKVNREAISFTETIHVMIHKNLKPINNITNKDIYWVFIRNKQVEPIITYQMEQTLNIQHEQWKQIFTMSAVVKGTKLRAFQYKILFNLIPCNLYLHRIQRNDSDKCATCNELDDLNHYFYLCQETTTFWRSFTTWWKNMTGGQKVLSKKVILVGILDKDGNHDTLNACLILAKWHIYKNKIKESSIFFYKFLCDLKYYIQIEKTIAIKNGKIIQYNYNWQQIENYIT
jgi:exonuclease III